MCCTLAIPHIKDTDRLTLPQVAVDGGNMEVESVTQPQRDHGKHLEVGAERVSEKLYVNW